MKKITAIVRAEKLEVLKDALFAADVRGMTINQVQGCGAQHGWKEYVRGNELLVNTIPKVQFTLICADEHVDGIVEIICNAARTGAVGDGKIWVAFCVSDTIIGMRVFCIPINQPVNP